MGEHSGAVGEPKGQEGGNWGSPEGGGGVREAWKWGGGGGRGVGDCCLSFFQAPASLKCEMFQTRAGTTTHQHWCSSQCKLWQGPYTAITSTMPGVWIENFSFRGYESWDFVLRWKILWYVTGHWISLSKGWSGWGYKRKEEAIVKQATNREGASNRACFLAHWN